MRKWVALVACLALAACNNAGNDDAGDNNLANQGSDPAPGEKMIPVEPDGGIGDGPDGGPLAGDNGSGASGPRPMLQNMEYQDFSTAIEAGLGCSFQSEPDGGTLLVATADPMTDKKGEAVVKINDTPVILQFEGSDYDTLAKGGNFTSEALSVTVKRADGDGKRIGVETMGWPATMQVAQDEGGSNSYEGTYACGA